MCSYTILIFLIVVLILQGILGVVKYDNKTLEGKWTVTGFPLEQTSDVSRIVLQSINDGPVFYEGQLTIPEGETPLDTFLDTTGWGKVLCFFY